MALKPFTRAIAREYRIIKYKNMRVTEAWIGEVDWVWLEEAKDFLVMSLTGKTKKEIDEMDDYEFKKLHEECLTHAWLDKEEEKQKNS